VQPLLQWKSSEYYTTCVCVFVALGIQHAMRHIVTCGLPRTTIFVALGIQHAMRMRYIVTCGLHPPSPALQYFSTFSHTWCNFQKNNIEHTMCVLVSTTTVV
jgi:hypothetical protein